MVWAAVILATTTAPAADKNGVSPTTISLPKGPGSIEGLGDSFQPSLNTGTAKYGLALRLPPGPAGHQPTLGLSYDGGGGNGPLGFGWSLHLPHIQRRTDRGIPTYGEPLGVPHVDTFVTESREELVPTADGFFFCENEGAFVRYRQAGDHWEGTRPDGTRLEFGLTVNGRIAEGSRTFTWLLERETDTRGNVIEYVYQTFPGGQNLHQNYLALVRYGPGGPPRNAFHFVAFEYEDRPDWFEDGRAGFLVRTGKRLRSVVIGTQGLALTNHAAGDFNHDGLTDHLNRRYDLRYLQYAGTASHWSLLSSVQLFGADGITALPAATFDYAVSNPPAAIDVSSNVWTSVNAPAAVLDHPQVDLVDLNADGLPDLLKTDSGGGGHTVAVNRGPIRTAEGWTIRWADPVAVDPGAGASWNFDLGSERTHLADLDGDGLADLVHQTADDTVFYFANRGHLAWGSRRDMSLDGPAPPAPFGNPAVRTADVDFDKRIDIIQSVDFGGGSVGYRVWLNLGSQSYSAPILLGSDGGFDLALPGVQIADANGDRVPDVARITPGAVLVAAGLGYGRFAAPQALVLPDVTLDEAQIERAKLADVNGDGLADLVLERAEPGVCWYWLNRGNYSWDARRAVTGLPIVDAQATVRWADLNGNGTTDLIYSDSAAATPMRLIEFGQLVSGGLAPNLLTRIANGIGRVTQIEYAPSTSFALADDAAGRPWPDPLPFPVTVVASTTVSDSLGHGYVTRYRYHDGYYDSVEKQFRGFAEVEQVDVGDPSAPTLISRSSFDTGRTFEAMKGRLLKIASETEEGAVFSREETTWANPPRVLRTGTNGVAVRFAHPVSSVKEILERGAGTPRRLENESAYDDYGNITRTADYGIVDDHNRSAFDDERITVTEFALNTTNWILHAPMRQVVQDENGQIISRSESFYDDETFSGNNAGHVTAGLLTLRRDWYSPASATGRVNSVRMKYDPFGNPIMTLDPLASGSGAPASGHSRELSYDLALHTFPESETIHIGDGRAPLVARASYDPGLATVLSSTDFNGNSTLYRQDALGRLTTIVQPGDTPAYPTAEFVYALAVPQARVDRSGLVRTGLVNYVETSRLDRLPGTAGSRRDHYFISRQFTDGLGRPLMTRTEAEPAPGGAEPRVVVSGAQLFNARTKPASVLNPFFTGRTGSLDALLEFEDIEAPGWQGQFHDAGALIPLDLAGAHRESTRYDATGRVVESRHPDGSFSRTEFEPLTARALDENDVNPDSPYFNTPTVQFVDGLGRLVRVDEITRLHDDGTPAGSPRTWTTRYRYDLNDRLTQIIDAQDNVKELRYDGLRRKVWMNDPDAGISTQQFDEASNLIETVDAKGQRTTFTYDGANRLLTEDYRDEASAEFSYHRSPDVAYHYDSPGGPVDQGDGSRATAQNTRGMLAWIDDPSSREFTSFDARGRIAWTVKQIPDPLLEPAFAFHPETAVAYKTAFEYDSLDRVTRMVYPDNDAVSYRYNARSLLEGIEGRPGAEILTRVDYLPSAQQAGVDFGNGVRTTYAYDSRRRMTSLLTAHVASSTELVHFRYELDATSNIDAIHDERPFTAVPADHPRRNSQRFAYDDLYRLTSVQYNAPNPPGANGGEIHYRYDRIGNMLAQTSDIDDRDRGIPVTDVGAMEYGGSAGRAGRIGRQANDPPGPHALSRIGGSNPGAREFPSDANGNLTQIDGMRCTWDFKDRLVAIEDGTMQAEYRYDYTGRRVIKKVWTKPSTNAAPNSPGRTATTSAIAYPGNHFEVREHDQPTKYVFNGAIRVARVTGSLSERPRQQRLRLRPGWNLASCALEGATLPAGSDLAAAYRWEPSTKGWKQLSTGETLAAGTVLWINARQKLILVLSGLCPVSMQTTIPVADGFFPGAGLEAWDLRFAHAEGAPDPPVAGWSFDSLLSGWRSSRSWLAAGFEFPEFLAPGEAVYLQTAAPVEVPAPPPTLRVRYYHEDHLGSASVATDADGSPVSETALYPFGQARHEEKFRRIDEPYKFARKERDQESHLDYLEARYLSTALARFINVDPKYVRPEVLGAGALTAFLARPQMNNLLSYALNNPIRYSDPSGLGAWGWFRENVWIPVVDDLDELDGARTVKVVGGAVEAVGGAAACPTTGIGCAAMVHGADVFTSGVLDRPSLTSQAVTAVTGSQTAGEYADFTIGAVLSAGTAARLPNCTAPSAPKGGLMPELYSRSELGGKTLPGWQPQTQAIEATAEGAVFRMSKTEWVLRENQAASATKNAVQMRGGNAWTEVCEPIERKADLLFGPDDPLP